MARVRTHKWWLFNYELPLQGAGYQMTIESGGTRPNVRHPRPKALLDACSEESAARVARAVGNFRWALSGVQPLTDGCAFKLHRSVRGTYAEWTDVGDLTDPSNELRLATVVAVDFETQRIAVRNEPNLTRSTRRVAEVMELLFSDGLDRTGQGYHYGVRVRHLAHEGGFFDFWREMSRISQIRFGYDGPNMARADIGKEVRAKLDDLRMTLHGGRTEGVINHPMISEPVAKEIDAAHTQGMLDVAATGVERGSGNSRPWSSRGGGRGQGWWLAPRITEEDVAQMLRQMGPAGGSDDVTQDPEAEVASDV